MSFDLPDPFDAIADLWFGAVPFDGPTPEVPDATKTRNRAGRSTPKLEDVLREVGNANDGGGPVPGAPGAPDSKGEGAPTVPASGK